MTEPTPPPVRLPDAADLALAKVAVPWLVFPHSAANTELAEALTAWLAARGIY